MEEEKIELYSQCVKGVFIAPVNLSLEEFDCKEINNFPKDIELEIHIEKTDLSCEELENRCQQYIRQNSYEDEICKGFLFCSCQLEKGKNVDNLWTLSMIKSNGSCPQGLDGEVAELLSKRPDDSDYSCICIHKHTPNYGHFVCEGSLEKCEEECWKELQKNYRLGGYGYIVDKQGKVCCCIEAVYEKDPQNDGKIKEENKTYISMMCMAESDKMERDGWIKGLPYEYTYVLITQHFR